MLLHNLNHTYFRGGANTTQQIKDTLMPQYLMIAESVYRKVKDSELFTEDTIENFNHLMTFIRKETLELYLNLSTTILILMNYLANHLTSVK